MLNIVMMGLAGTGLVWTLAQWWRLERDARRERAMLKRLAEWLRD